MGNTCSSYQIYQFTCICTHTTSLYFHDNGKLMVPLYLNKLFLCAQNSILLTHPRALFLQLILSLLHCHFYPLLLDNFYQHKNSYNIFHVKKKTPFFTLLPLPATTLIFCPSLQQKSSNELSILTLSICPFILS